MLIFNNDIGKLERKVLFKYNKEKLKIRKYFEILKQFKNYKYIHVN